MGGHQGGNGKEGLRPSLWDERDGGGGQCGHGAERWKRFDTREADKKGMKIRWAVGRKWQS